jgi:hypothetical protein
MANQQVIVSVLGDTKNFSRAMSNSSKIMAAFGAAVVAGVAMAGRAFVDFVGDSIKAAENAVSIQRRFEFLAQQSGLFGDETEKLTKRVQDYARAQSFATGVDDEAIVSAATKLLAFRKVAESADELNGVYDRTIAVSLDVAAVLGGTGDGLENIESIAPKVGKALENPIKNLGTLAKIGVVFTDVEKEKLIAIQETNGIYAAQEYLLEQLEIRYGGAGEAGAKASEKIQARFEDLQEQVGDKLLPAIETMADEFGKWLDGPAGQKAISDFVESFRQLAEYLANPDNVKRLQEIAEGFGKLAGALSDIFVIADKFAGLPVWLAKSIFGGNYADIKRGLDGFTGNLPSGPPKNNPPRFGGPDILGRGSPAKMGGVVVNFNAPVDSVSAGREIARVLKDYDRANGGRRK